MAANLSGKRWLALRSRVAAAMLLGDAAAAHDSNCITVIPAIAKTGHSNVMPEPE